MKVSDILDICEDCTFETVVVDENDNVLTEAAIRQFKRTGNTLTAKYRCTSGQKEGKLVSKPGDCGKRKDPKKIRQGKKVMRSKKKQIHRKGAISKRRSISKTLQRINKRLSGN